MRPIYIFAILGVLFVLYVESNKASATVASANASIAASNAAAAEAAADSGDTTAGIIGALAGAGQDAYEDYSGYGLD
jgi:hypothetical protein